MNFVIPCFILLTQISVFNSKSDQKIMVNANKIVKYESSYIYFNSETVPSFKIKESAAEIKSLIEKSCK